MVAANPLYWFCHDAAQFDFEHNYLVQKYVFNYHALVEMNKKAGKLEILESNENKV
jgi:hypothetical protein